MSLTLENINLTMQKAGFANRKAGTQTIGRAFAEYMNTLKNPDTQIVFISGLDSADKVVADVACKLYALWIRKPTASTVDAWAKGSNHATVAAADGDVAVFLVGTSGGGREYLLTFPDGLPLGTGLTVGSHTTVDGNTKSATADAWTGFAIIGAA